MLSRKQWKAVLRLCLILTVLTSVLMANSIVFGADLASKVENTDTKILIAIDKAVDKVADAKDVDKIIDNLLNYTDGKVQQLIEQAAKDGEQLKLYLIEVDIGGEKVLVDPCEVIDD